MNELHYDNAGTDSGEGAEISGPAGTSLSNYDLVFYNGIGGAQYDSLRLSGTIPDEKGTGTGAVWFPVVPNIQNGGPDGLVLYHWPTSTVVQRISYEGTFTAVGGVADGLMLPDIQVSETGTTPTGYSLQLTGSGTALGDFTWTAPRTASPGLLNAGQTFTAAVVHTAALAVLPGLIAEGATATLRLVLTPAPPSPVTYTLQATNASGLLMPPQITVPANGIATVSVTVVADGVAEGFQEAIITAQPPDSTWPVAAAGLKLIDPDRPHVTAQGAIRLMSYNVKLGLGAPGSNEFNAVREVVERISPDVLVMQEVNSDNSFADFLTLAEHAGFPSGAAHVSISGDAFAGQPYAGGDISGSQDLNVVLVSRFPVKQRIQVGRGATNRSEMTRYPILSVIDVPWLSDGEDPVIVAVHLKADGGDANNFRRALEARRLREAMTAAGFSGTAGNVIVSGDFNATDWQPQPVSYETNVPAVQSPGTGFFADGTALPFSFVPGSDLLSPGFTLPYKPFPHSGMNPFGLTALSLKQADGSDERTFAFASYKLDYFFVSQPIASRGGVQTEIYNSTLEPYYDGLPKRATLPDANLSTTASDHFAVFADIPLLTLPSLSVTFSRDWVLEGETALTVTVSSNPPPAAEVIVSVDAWRDGRITSATNAVTLGPGHPSAVVPVKVPWQPGIEAHRRVAMTASAAGFHDGTGHVTVRNREASGLLVISKYHEPATGSSPRALELLNASGTPIDFSRTTLGIRRYSNGDADGVPDAEATSGTLPAGEVLVAGDPDTGNYMVAQGLLPAPAVPFTSQADHTVFLNAAGDAAFLLDHILFNGNDALEVLLNGTRCDVFGDIGHDPGTAWTGPGADSTKDGVLMLRPSIATGSSGWRQPGLRFTFAAASLSGFGVAPAITDPFKAWTTAAGLSGMSAAPASDPDGDGAQNLLEYALMSRPDNGSSRPLLTPQPGGVRRRLRSSDGALTFTVEVSTGAAAWSAAIGAESAAITFPDGSVERTFTLTGTRPARVFLRQRVSRP